MYKAKIITKNGEILLENKSVEHLEVELVNKLLENSGSAVDFALYKEDKEIHSVIDFNYITYLINFKNGKNNENW